MAQDNGRTKYGPKLNYIYMNIHYSCLLLMHLLWSMEISSLDSDLQMNEYILLEVSTTCETSLNILSLTIFKEGELNWKCYCLLQLASRLNNIILNGEETFLGSTQTGLSMVQVEFAPTFYSLLSHNKHLNKTVAISHSLWSLTSAAYVNVSQNN